MEQPILEFGKLIGGGGNSPSKGDDLGTLRKLFETQGWAFVKMPQDSVDLVRPAMTGFESIFQDPERFESLSSKHRWGARAPLGLRGSPHAGKRSFTCPTGTELNKSIAKGLPSHESQLQLASLALAAKLDDHLLQIVNAFSVEFFGLSPSELGVGLDLPLLSSTSAKEDSNNTKTASFALFDVAYYCKNNNKVSSFGANEGAKCAAHYDPGLISLWAGETRPGLKLLDGTGQWVPPPNPDKNVFVLWLGKAARDGNPKFKPAMHRVDRIDNIDENNNGRLSLWSELCTRAQLSPPGSDFRFVTADAIQVTNALWGTERLRVRIEGGNFDKALETIERILRMPMSKSMMVPVLDKDGYVAKTRGIGGEEDSDGSDDMPWSDDD